MRKYSLKELEHLLPVLDENEQKAIMGGGSGSYYDPFTRDEFLSMQICGNWQGGYVYGMNYIGKNENVSWSMDGTLQVGSYTYYNVYSSDILMTNMLNDVYVTASKYIIEQHDDFHWAFDFVEGIGLRASFGSKVRTEISSGKMSISGLIVPFSTSYDWTQYAEVYVNGKMVRKQQLTRNGYYISAPGQYVTGETTVDLLNLHGYVEVKIFSVGNLKDNSTGNSSVSRTDVVYSQYR